MSESIGDTQPQVPPDSVSGYVEGYYGILLDWSARVQLLESLSRQQMNTYLYAPKSDPRHRQYWRQLYDQRWIRHFTDFCVQASVLDVSVWAGVAPGLDFNYADVGHGPDFTALVNKCNQLVDAGAGSIVLLLDDIEPATPDRLASWSHEAEAQARLVNSLSRALPVPLAIVPRIYANELHEKSPEYPDYLSILQHHLDVVPAVLLCGSHIIAPAPTPADIRQVCPEWRLPVILWDNLYANDYCPRRLFVGPWRGRNPSDPLLLNPTGMLHTDRLLIDMVGGVRRGSSVEQAWHDALIAHQVPEAFQVVAEAFSLPFFSTGNPEHGLDQGSSAEIDAALQTLLWRWQAPLAREWYPYLFTYRQDRQLASGEFSRTRIRKSYSVAMSDHLLTCRSAASP